MALDPITAIQDLDTLKALAKHMRSYEHKLERRNRELLVENARLRGELAPEQIDLMLQRNQEELARLRQQVFGSTSERLPPPPEVVEAEKAAKAAKEPQRGHGPTPQPRLPVETVDHELAGDQMQEMGATEDSELIGVELRKLRRELQGARVGRSGDQFTVAEREQRPQKVGAREISDIVLHGNAQALTLSWPFTARQKRATPARQD